MSARRNRSPRIEILEDRSMLAVGILDNGWLGVLGTKDNDHIRIADSGSGYVTVVENGYAAGRAACRPSAIRGPRRQRPVEVDGDRDYSRVGRRRQRRRRHSPRLRQRRRDRWQGQRPHLGGAGSDWVIGEAGHDHLFGGEDVDVVSGGGGNDSSHGDGMATSSLVMPVMMKSTPGSATTWSTAEPART